MNEVSLIAVGFLLLGFWLWLNIKIVGEWLGIFPLWTALGIPLAVIFIAGFF